MAPNLLSIADPVLLNEVYHRHADKTPFYSTGMAGPEAPLLQTQDDSLHAAKLKSLGPTVNYSSKFCGQSPLKIKYSLRHIRLLESSVDEQLTQTLAVLKDRYASSNKSLDIAEWTR